MKKYLILLVISVLSVAGSVAKAQLVKSNGNKDAAELQNRDWYNCSSEKDQIYGACVNEAYEFLKNKKAKARPIVAMIGTGIDTEHEALKGNLWKNPKEKADGKDNDKNGYVDDMYGWNFLGGKDGQMMPYVVREGEREFFRLKDKYGDIIKDGDKYYNYATGERKQIPAPENLDEFNYYRFTVLKESRLANDFGAIKMVHVGRDYVKMFDKELREKFPDKEDFTIAELAANCQATDPKDSTLRNFYLYAIGMGASFTKNDSWNNTYKNYVSDKRVPDAEKKYAKTFEKYGNDRRKEIVGDNYLDLNDRVYGNNVLLTSDAMYGTMLAGVIVGKRGVEGRNNPIAEQAELMTLVVQAGEGEPYLKDMALAIRYAVDNGASIVVLPQQNTLYPNPQRQWMVEAIRYAGEKGALVIAPTWEMATDMNETPFYPNRSMDGGKELTNLIVTGVSGKDGMPSVESNFGGNVLDIFAPGMQILSTCTGDTYQMGTGSGMASATVAGVAALLKTYYPKLTGTQIRDILLKTATSRKGVEVEKGVMKNRKRQLDLYLFEQLCLSGGIVNAYEAVKAADQLDL